MAGLDTIDDSLFRQYEFDVFNPEEDWDAHDIVPLVALRELVEHLRPLLFSAQPDRALFREFTRIDDIIRAAPYLGLNEAQVTQRMTRLFSTHVREFDRFVAAIDRPGWGRHGSLKQLRLEMASAETG